MRLSAVLLIIICVASASARKERSTHQRLVPKASVEEIAQYDSLAADSASVTISGLTNKSRRAVSSLTVDIEYLDAKGRQLHRRQGLTVTFPEPIPPGETRQAKIPTWDIQSVRYYHLSPPARTRSQATPFWVKITPNTITTPR